MPLGNDTNATNTNDQSIVEVGVALPSGTNIIGKVGIDQTTDGTTNAIVSRGQYRSNPSALSNNNYSPIQLDKYSNVVTQNVAKFHSFEERVFSATTDLINIGTSETAFYLFRNPNGSGKLAQIFSFTISIVGAGTVKIYSNPTITSTGTTLTVVNNYIKTSPASESITCFSQPTASANGTLMSVIRSPAQAPSLFVNLENFILLDANRDILFTVKNDSNNTPSAIAVKWIER